VKQGIVEKVKNNIKLHRPAIPVAFYDEKDADDNNYNLQIKR
jgi:hypothetical protein